MTIISLTTTLISAMSIISVGLAVPTTYNQRQDGGLNVAAKLENIMIVIAIPSSSTGSKSNSENSELASYLTLLSDHPNPSPTQYDVVAETNNADSKADQEIHNQDEDDDVELFTDEDDSKEVEQQPQKSSEKIKVGVKSAPGDRRKSRTLWSQVQDVDNRQGASLKKELSWGRDEDGAAVANTGEIDDPTRSSDHNEVGLIANDHLTLLGSGIEDCGPERRRNSYGICQAQPEE